MLEILVHFCNCFSCFSGFWFSTFLNNYESLFNEIIFTLFNPFFMYSHNSFSVMLSLSNAVNLFCNWPFISGDTLIFSNVWYLLKSNTMLSQEKRMDIYFYRGSSIELNPTKFSEIYSQIKI